MTAAAIASPIGGSFVMLDLVKKRVIGVARFEDFSPGVAADQIPAGTPATNRIEAWPVASGVSLLEAIGGDWRALSFCSIELYSI
jgi:hypothetical protein